MEIKTGVVGMDTLLPVYKEKPSLDLVINNGKTRSLFSKGLKNEFSCDKQNRLGRGRHKV